MLSHLDLLFADLTHTRLPLARQDVTSERQGGVGFQSNDCGRASYICIHWGSERLIRVPLPYFCRISCTISGQLYIYLSLVTLWMSLCNRQRRNPTTRVPEIYRVTSRVRVFVLWQWRVANIFYHFHGQTSRQLSFCSILNESKTYADSQGVFEACLSRLCHFVCWTRIILAYKRYVITSSTLWILRLQKGWNKLGIYCSSKMILSHFATFWRKPTSLSPLEVLSFWVNTRRSSLHALYCRCQTYLSHIFISR